MKIANVSYDQWKSLVDSKGLLPQYVENPDSYELFAVEANVSWEIRVLKDGGSEVTDFEANIKNTANAPLEYRSTDGLLKIAPSKFTEALSLYVDGENGFLTVGANATEYAKTHYPFDLTLSGVDVAWTGATSGDYVDFEIGVYTNPASEATFISLVKFGNKYRLISSDGARLFDVPTVKLVPSTVTISGTTYDTYIRTKVVNTGLTSLTITINIMGWK